MQVTIPDAVKRGVVNATFDFYDTLTLPMYDPLLKTWRQGIEPNPFMLTEVFRLACEGWNIYIITDSNKTPLQQRLIKAFITFHDLPVRGTIYTAGNEKTAFIEACRAGMHFDDDPFEIDNLPTGVVGILIPHPSDRMTDEDYAVVEAPVTLIGT